MVALPAMHGDSDNESESGSSLSSTSTSVSSSAALLPWPASSLPDEKSVGSYLGSRGRRPGPRWLNGSSRARSTHRSRRRSRRSTVLVAVVLLLLGTICVIFVLVSIRLHRAKAAAVQLARARQHVRDNLLTSAPYLLCSSGRIASSSSTPPHSLSSVHTHHHSSQHLAEDIRTVAAFANTLRANTCRLSSGSLLRYESLLGPGEGLSEDDHEADDSSIDVNRRPRGNNRTPNLRLPVAGRDQGQRDRIYIAFLLFNSEDRLPTFIEQITTLAAVLGNERLFVSVYENGSTDLTPQLLLLLAEELSYLGVEYRIVARGQSAPHAFLRDEDIAAGMLEIPPANASESAQAPPEAKHSRIDDLARLRNFALEPLRNSIEADSTGGAFSTVIFMNDVFFCASDILELLYQREVQGADMVCGLDYFRDLVRSHVIGAEYYDTWVGRTINGHAMSTPETLGRVAAMHPPSRRRYLRSLPFQVFSCWNGMVVVGADAFLEPDATRFRSIDASDFASEAYLFNVDMWKHGRGKIAVVPKVKLAYSLADYDALHDGNDCDNGDLEAILSRKTAQAGGERHIELVNPEEEIIWLRDPPALVDFRPFNFHRPLFEEPTMRPWNETSIL